MSRGFFLVNFYNEHKGDASFLASMIPLVGDAKDIQEVLTGKDLITGEQLSGGQRLLTVVAAFLPIAGGKAVREVGEKFAKSVDEIADMSAEAFEKAFKNGFVEGTGKADDWLKCPIAPKGEYSTIKIDKNHRSLSPKGKPNSTVDLLYEDGTVKQRRVYGEDGKGVYDIDFTDHGNPNVHPPVHRHDLKWDGENFRGHYSPTTPWND